MLLIGKLGFLERLLASYTKQAIGKESQQSREGAVKMTDRDSQRRPWWDEEEEEDRYGRDRNQYERDWDYGQQGKRGYGYGNYGQGNERRYDRDWESERRGLVERGYGYGDYGQEHERRYD